MHRIIGRKSSASLSNPTIQLRFMQEQSTSRYARPGRAIAFVESSPHNLQNPQNTTPHTDDPRAENVVYRVLLLLHYVASVGQSILPSCRSPPIMVLSLVSAGASLLAVCASVAAASVNPTCPESNDTHFTATNGAVYEIECGIDRRGNDIKTVQVDITPRRPRRHLI